MTGWSWLTSQKACLKKRLWPTLMYYSGSTLTKLRKTTKRLSQSSRCADRDSKRSPPTHNSEAPSLEPPFSVAPRWSKETGTKDSKEVALLEDRAEISITAKDVTQKHRTVKTCWAVKLSCEGVTCLPKFYVKLRKTDNRNPINGKKKIVFQNDTQAVWKHWSLLLLKDRY
jgi:hypothetical protein